MFDKNNSYKSYKLESDDLDAKKHLSEITCLPEHSEGSGQKLKSFTTACFRKLLIGKRFIINPFPGLLHPPEISFSYSKITSLVLIIVLFLANPVFAQTITDPVSLYAKTGSGDYYTLYPDGLSKDSAYIGGFKSAQLDPLEENIYFFDTGLKVISKLIYKVEKYRKLLVNPNLVQILIL